MILPLVVVTLSINDNVQKYKNIFSVLEIPDICFSLMDKKTYEF